ncbi:MAG: 4-(cytidine 5'-diphospho)-2-C-methyl-D-erythritol kinase [Oscillospiraceae bacterium]
MTVIANAKLNLFLDITGRRDDGYHTLETVMQSVTLSDIVEVDFSEGKGISLTCDDPFVPTDGRNTAYRAAERYLACSGITAAVKIAIAKRIPSGAGMGGGSADAAAVLHALDKRFGAVSQEELYRIAASIGADVPFCLAGGTRQCRGIGEQISGCPMVKDCCFLVVKPDFSCFTGEAYARYDNAPIPPSNRMSEFVAAVGDGGFADKMYNTFQLLYNDSRIEEICCALVAAGAAGAMLTGSGAAVFGVFYEEGSATEAARRFPTYFTSVCRPASDGVYVV